MKKIKISIITFMIMALVIGTIGCNIDEYKTNAKIELNNYISELSFLEGGRPTKNHINGLAFDKIVDEGKSTIDSASSRKDVDKQLDNAKRAINAIPIVFRSDTSDHTVALTNEVLTFPTASHYTFYLKHFDKNITFECTADSGIITYHANDKASSSDHETWFGREPSILNWRINFGINSEENHFVVLVWQDFIDIIIKIDDLTIGYMVVEMYHIETGYAPKLLAFDLNSKIDNEYQAMDEEEMNTAIEIIKNEHRNKEES